MVGIALIFEILSSISKKWLKKLNPTAHNHSDHQKLEIEIEHHIPTTKIPPLYMLIKKTTRTKNRIPQ